MASDGYGSISECLHTCAHRNQASKRGKLQVDTLAMCRMFREGWKFLVLNGQGAEGGWMLNGIKLFLSFNICQDCVSVARRVAVLNRKACQLLAYAMLIAFLRSGMLIVWSIPCDCDSTQRHQAFSATSASRSCLGTSLPACVHSSTTWLGSSAVR